MGGSLRIGTGSQVLVVGELGGAATGSGERFIGFFLTKNKLLSISRSKEPSY